MLPLALAGCTRSGHDPSVRVATSFATGVLAAEHDSGDPADRRAVRTATVAALSDEIRAFVVGPGLRGRRTAEVLAAVTGPARTRERAALLGRARSATLATELQRSFSSYAEQEFGPGWTGSGSETAWLDRDVWAAGAFHVDRWQGVRVDNDTARVLVRGEDRGTAWGGRSRRAAWAQYKLILRRDPTAPHGWRITHQQAASTAA